MNRLESTQSINSRILFLNFQQLRSPPTVPGDRATLRRTSPYAAVMKLVCGLFVSALLSCAEGRIRGGTRCHAHEEVRDGAVWIVDCRGNAVNELSALELGEYRYAVDRSEWSSRDLRMSTIAVDLPPGKHCDSAGVERWARCMELPLYFAWCGSDKVARFVGDGAFPSYADSTADIARVALLCAPRNATTRILPPMRAYNERAVREARESREQAENVVIGVMCGVAFCCWISSLCTQRRYSRV